MTRASALKCPLETAQEISQHRKSIRTTNKQAHAEYCDKRLHVSSHPTNGQAGTLLGQFCSQDITSQNKTVRHWREINHMTSNRAMEVGMTSSRSRFRRRKARARRQIELSPEVKSIQSNIIRHPLNRDGLNCEGNANNSSPISSNRLKYPLILVALFALATSLAATSADCVQLVELKRQLGRTADCVNISSHNCTDARGFNQSSSDSFSGDNDDRSHIHIKHKINATISSGSFKTSDNSNFKFNHQSKATGRLPPPIWSVQLRQNEAAAAKSQVKRTVGWRLRRSPGTDKQAEAAAAAAAARPDQSKSPQQTTDLTRIVAVSGQTIELQCPLASELLANSNSAPDTQQDQQQQQRRVADQKIIWRKDGQRLSQLNSTRLRLNQMNSSSSLTIMQAQPKLDESIYECALVVSSTGTELDNDGDNNNYDSSSGQRLAVQKVHQFELKLLVAPRLAPFEFPQDVQVGMKVLLTCSALEGQQPISFVWLKDNQIVLGAPEHSLHQQQQHLHHKHALGDETDDTSEQQANGDQLPQPISSLSQLHRQQLADKFALSAHSAYGLGASKSEYVIITSRHRGRHRGDKLTPTAQADRNDDDDAHGLDDDTSGDDETLVVGAGGGGQDRVADKNKEQLGGASSSSGGNNNNKATGQFKRKSNTGAAAPAMHLIDSSIKIRQADDYSILSIDSIELKHSGRYTCSAQNEAARTSHSSQLVINAPPTLTIEPKDGDLVSGQSVVLECAASGQPRPSLSWLRARESSASKQLDLVPIYDNLRYTILANGSLAINNVTQREQGYYMCSARNGFGPEASKLIKITVHEPARVRTRYKWVESRIDERAQLTCSASGEPPLTLMWFDKDDKLIDHTSSDKRFIVDNSKEFEQRTKGSSSSASSSTISEPNHYSDQDIQNEPKTTTTAAPLASTSALAHNSHNNNSYAIEELSLYITRSQRSDSGHYTCQASNKFGHDKMAVNLLVQDVPDRVSELKVTNITATTIALRWQLGFTGNSPVTSYLVQYQSDDPLDDLLLMSSSSSSTSGSAATSLMASPLPSSAASASAGGELASSTTASSSPLPPFGHYRHFSPELVSELLSGALDSNQLNQQQDKLGQIKTTTTTTSGGSSLRAALDMLNSLAPLGAGKSNDAGNKSPAVRTTNGGGPTTTTAMTADEAIDRTLVELTVEQTATSLVVKDLNPFCVYRLRLAGINKIGLGEFSDWIRAKTDEAPPSGSALKVSAIATGPNSIKLTWLPPDRRTWNGQLVRFQIGYRPIDSTFELTKLVDWSPPTLMQTLAAHGDRARVGGTAWRDTLVASNNGTVTTTTTTTATAAVAVAATATNWPTSGTTTNQSLSNNNSPDADKIASADTRDKSGTGSGSGTPYALRQHLRQLLAQQQQELVAHLTNLQRSTSYLVWIQAANSRGLGPQSHAISVRTLDDVPPSAPALRIQSTSATSITIAWSMLANFVSPANQYLLFYRRVPPPPSSSSSSQLPPTQPHQYAFNTLRHGNRSAAPSDFGPSSSGTLFSEPGPFIERTISSQQLLVSMGQQQQQHQNLMLARRMEGSQLDMFQNQKLASSHSMEQKQQQQQYQQFAYTLDQLECGSVYELYMTTRNSVGKSEPSPVLTTRTLGEPPLAPNNKNNLFAKIGAQDVLLNLASWSTGGCPLKHVSVRYKQLPTPLAAASSNLTAPANATPANGNQSTANGTPPSFSVGWPVSASVPPSLLASINAQQSSSKSLGAQQASLTATTFGNSNNNDRRPLVFASLAGSPAHLLGGDQTIHHHYGGDHLQAAAGAQFALKNLQPSTGYELEISAHNAAGHTTAQYEFVTAGLNGSRSGYTRREGVYRLDQRGQPIESPGGSDSYGSDQDQPSSSLSSFAGADNQGAAYGSHGGVAPTVSALWAQLAPLMLTLLCLICLIISTTFCYYRLSDSWKAHSATARRDSMDDTMRSVCSGSGGSSGQSQLGGVGGGGGGSSTMGASCKSVLTQNWSRVLGAGGHHHHHEQQQQHLHHQLHDRDSLNLLRNHNYQNQRTLQQHAELIEEQQQASPHSSTGADSPPQAIGNGTQPTASDQLHHQYYTQQEYCNTREALSMGQQQQHQHVISATLNPRSSTFSQSVSMKDFNLIPPLGAASATLNFSHNRQPGHGAALAAAALANTKVGSAATMARGRLFDIQAMQDTPAAYGMPSNATELATSVRDSAIDNSSRRICSVYGTCKQRHGGLELTGNSSCLNQACYSNVDSGPAAQQLPVGSHETSWTTAPSASAITSNGTASKTGSGPPANITYAIPASSAYLNQEYTGDQHTGDGLGGDGDEQRMSSYQCDAYDAGQGNIDACIEHLMRQQQQQQQQHRYALLMNQQLKERQQQQLTTTNPTFGPAQSVIDSSSSSSGIGADISSHGMHLDCRPNAATNGNLQNGAHYQLNGQSPSLVDTSLCNLDQTQQLRQQQQQQQVAIDSTD